MSPRTPEQFQAIRNEKINLITNAALDLFATKGFANASISMIAKEAGISKGLLYNYFKSKDELLEHILTIGLDEIDNIYDLNNDGELEVKEMEFFIREFFHKMKFNTKFWKLYFQVSIQPDVIEKLQEKLSEMILKFTGITIRYFENLGFTNPKSEAILFGSTLDGIVFNYALAPKFYPIDDIIEELINKYCKRLKS